jgi:hypothetical protein
MIMGGNPDDIPYMDMSRGASVSHEGGVGTLYHTSLPPSNVAPNAQSFFSELPRYETKPSASVLQDSRFDAPCRHPR